MIIMQKQGSVHCGHGLGSESTEVRHKLHAEHEWLPRFFRAKDRRLAGDIGVQ